MPTLISNIRHPSTAQHAIHIFKLERSDSCHCGSHLLFYQQLPSRPSKDSVVLLEDKTVITLLQRKDLHQEALNPLPPGVCSGKNHLLLNNAAAAASALPLSPEPCSLTPGVNPIELLISISTPSFLHHVHILASRSSRTLPYIVISVCMSHSSTYVLYSMPTLPINRLTSLWTTRFSLSSVFHPSVAHLSRGSLMSVFLFYLFYLFKSSLI